MKRIKPPQMILIAVLIGLAVLVVPQFVSEREGARAVSGDTITQTMSTVATNATAEFQIRLIEGSDAEHESTHIFESFNGLAGVGKVVLDATSLKISVAYDDVATSPDAIRSRLVASGYLAPTAADATKTRVSPDGAVQTLSIGDDGSRFDPTMILAEAGIPLELEFAPGTECRTAVKIPQLGASLDISNGGVLKLDGLVAGEYEIVCSQDGHEGVLIVE